MNSMSWSNRAMASTLLIRTTTVHYIIGVAWSNVRSLWVISGHSASSNRCPLYPPKRTSLSGIISFRFLSFWAQAVGLLSHAEACRKSCQPMPTGSLGPGYYPVANLARAAALYTAGGWHDELVSSAAALNDFRAIAKLQILRQAQPDFGHVPADLAVDPGQSPFGE